jgi:glyoxylase-like metal-dependent hydrolase (beta-lactamase superfamily II)
MNATDDWYEVEALTDHSYRIAEGSMFNTYLVVGEKRALQIDAGGGFGDLRGLVEGLVDVPVRLLLSHSHWDHIGAAHRFDDVLIDGTERHPDGRVTTDVVTDDFGYSPADFVADWRGAGRSFPDGVDVEGFEIPPIEGVEAVSPGDRIDLGGRTLELVGVPGHSPGQLAALDREDGVLYGADVLHNGYGLYIHFEGCDIEEYVTTLERVIDLRDEGAFDTLYLAHARPLSGDDLDILDDYLAGLRAVLAGDLEYEMTEEHPRARRYEVAGNPVLTKPELD